MPTIDYFADFSDFPDFTDLTKNYYISHLNIKFTL
jgi:hypothetical protein